MTHGRSGYDKHGCRCALCRAANTAHVARVRAARLLRLRANPVPEHDDGHGTQGGYDAGCRCEACSMVRRVRYWRGGGPRRHAWREWVCQVHRDARDAWEAAFEAATSMTYERGLISRERRRERRGGRREVTDFIEDHPPPVFRQVLTDGAGYVSPYCAELSPSA